MDKWISVKDKEIPKDLPVLVFWSPQIKGAIWDSDCDRFIPDCGCSGWVHSWGEINATHWRPLPEPPEEGE